MTTTTDAVAWVSQGPITDDPYRTAVYKEIKRRLTVGYVLDELDVQEERGRQWAIQDSVLLTRTFRVVVARRLPRLDPDREQEPMVVEGDVG